MGKKRRFGIAIDAALADRLDAIAKSMSIDRSKLVEKALSEFIEEHSHNIQRHKCCGVIVAEIENCGNVNKTIEFYKDIIVSYMHNHVEKRCICLFIVSGDSKRIDSLHKDLTINSHRTRYIPMVHG